ncbi:ABC transporter permease [Jiangella gansuensis]|uniref:ABC transporter permease n=1 Tax=Jiangella gansuensis TaxID=281473 RepID=UPI0004AE6D07|nr:ABC transporter permease [Jiangella gansuensis]
MTTLTTPLTAAPVRRRGRLRIVLPAVVVGIYLLAAVVGPVITGYDPTATSVPDRLLPPGATLSNGDVALLGTDQVGRDLLGQIMQGARVSMVVGVLTLLLAGVVGSLAGLVAGYRGGIVDTVVMRLADIQLAFPSILLAVFVAAVLGPSVPNVVLSLSITNWPVFARVARAQAMAVRDRDFANATRTLGATARYVVRHCVAPAVLSPVLVIATVQFGLVVVAEASLSFLGLGVPVGTPSWGTTIANGREFLDTAWWISAMPGIALVVLVVCAGTLGDALRDRLDPYRTTR